MTRNEKDFLSQQCNTVEKKAKRIIISMGSEVLLEIFPLWSRLNEKKECRTINEGWKRDDHDELDDAM